MWPLRLYDNSSILKPSFFFIHRTKDTYADLYFAHISHSCDEQGNHVTCGEEEAGRPQGGPVCVGSHRGHPQPETNCKHGQDFQVSLPHMGDVMM